MNIDSVIFTLLNQFAGRWRTLDAVAIFLAARFEYFLLFFVLVLFLKKIKKGSLMVAQIFSAAVLSRLIITPALRFLWYRPRPFLVESVNLLVHHSNEGSFPSGHAALYFAISTVVFHYYKKEGVLFFLASFFITISRVFVGIHWPSDILAGAAIGIFSGKMVIYLFKKSSFIKKMKTLMM